MPEVFFVSSIQADNGQILSLDPFKEHVFAHKVFEMFVDVKSNHVLQLFSIELDHQPWNKCPLVDFVYEKVVDMPAHIQQAWDKKNPSFIQGFTWQCFVCGECNTLSMFEVFVSKVGLNFTNRRLCTEGGFELRS